MSVGGTEADSLGRVERLDDEGEDAGYDGDGDILPPDARVASQREARYRRREMLGLGGGGGQVGGDAGGQKLSKRWDLGAEPRDADVLQIIRHYVLSREQATEAEGGIIAGFEDIKIESGREPILREFPGILFDTLSRPFSPQLEGMNAVQAKLLQCQVAMLVEQRSILRDCLIDARISHGELGIQRDEADERAEGALAELKRAVDECDRLKAIVSSGPSLADDDPRLAACIRCHSADERIVQLEGQLKRSALALSRQDEQWREMLSREADESDREYRRVYGAYKKVQNELALLRQSRVVPSVNVPSNRIHISGTMSGEGPDEMEDDDDADVITDPEVLRAMLKVANQKVAQLEKSKDAPDDAAVVNGMRFNCSHFRRGGEEDTVPYAVGRAGGASERSVRGMIDEKPSLLSNIHPALISSQSSPHVSTTFEQDMMMKLIETLGSFAGVNLQAVPTYSGKFGQSDDSWEKYTRQVGQRCAGQTDSIKIQTVRDHLLGDAKIAADTLSPDELTNYKIFCSAMGRRLLRVGTGFSAQRRLRLQDIQQGERVMEAFIAEIETEAPKAFPEMTREQLDVTKKDLVYRGVSDYSIQTELLRLSETLTFAQLSNEAIRLSHIQLAVTQMREHGRSASKQGGKHRQDDKSSAQAFRTRAVAGSVERVVAPSSGYRSDRICVSCKQPGHVTRECPKCGNCGQAGHERRDCRLSRRCYRCNKEGHLSYDCTEQQSSVNSRQSGNIAANSGRVFVDVPRTSSLSSDVVGSFVMSASSDTIEPTSELPHMLDSLRGVSGYRATMCRVQQPKVGGGLVGPPIEESFSIRGIVGKGALDCGSQVSILCAAFMRHLILASGMRPQPGQCLRPSQIGNIRSVTGDLVQIEGAIVLPVRYRSREPTDVWFVIQKQGASAEMLFGTNSWPSLGFAVCDTVENRTLVLAPQWLSTPGEGSPLTIPKPIVDGPRALVPPPIVESLTPSNVTDAVMTLPIIEKRVSADEVRTESMNARVRFAREAAADVTSAVTVVKNELFVRRVVVDCLTTVLGGQTVWITGRVVDKPSNETGPVVFEVDQDEMSDLYCPPTIVEVTSKGRICMMIENRRDEALILSKGKSIGRIDSIDKFEELPEKEIAESKSAKYGSVDAVEPDTEPTAYEQGRVARLMAMIKWPESDVLSEEDRMKVKQLVAENHDLFSLSDDELRQTDSVMHTVDTGKTPPIKQRQRPVPFGLREQVEEIVDDLLRRRLITPSSSPWSSPIVLVRKKDGRLRFCIDFRLLNKHTVKDAYPMPDIDSLLLSLGGKKFLSAFDMDNGYHQIMMDPRDRSKTAFATLNGHYEWNVMPFGLTAAVATFQRFMEKAMEGVLGKFVYQFVDDTLVASETLDEHLEHLGEFFRRMRMAGGGGGGLLLKPTKCTIAVDELKFLGHVVGARGVQVDPDKVEKIVAYPRPTNVAELRRYMGMVGYTRKFVRGFSKIAAPLNALFDKRQPFDWTDDHEKAFVELKSRMCTAPVLAFPDFEAAKSGERPFIITTDASVDGLGAVLKQRGTDGFVHPLCYSSRSCKPAERNYHVTDLEAAAVMFAIDKYHTYILGLPVIVYTDHQPLVAMFKTNGKLKPRLVRWSLLLQQYNLTIIYKSGATNVIADALSRVRGDVTVGDKNDEVYVGEEMYIRQVLMKEVRTSPALPPGVDDWDETVAVEYTDLVAYLRDHVTPSKNVEEIVAVSREMVLIDDRLYHVEEDGRMRVVVPTKYRKSLVLEAHAGLFAGHFTGRAVWANLRREYYWPQMRSDVNRWCSACLACAATRRGRCVIPPMQSIISDRPFQIVGVDVLKVGLTEDGNKYIVTFIDHFSKYVMAYPSADKSAKTIAQLFLERVVCVHGAPEQLLSDRGGEFLNEIMQAVTEILGVEKVNTAGYAPRTDGITERVHRTILSMLKRSTPVPIGWDLRLPFVVFAYNMSEHSSTGESPFFLIYGRDPKFPSKVAPAFQTTPYMTDYDDYKHVMQAGLQEATEHVRENLRVSRDRQKRYFDRDKGAVPNRFLVGMRVMIFQPNVAQSARIPKLAWPFKGPFRILETSPTSVRVRLTDQTDGEGEWVPMERCCHCPKELSDETYTGKGKQRKKFGEVSAAKRRSSRKEVGGTAMLPMHQYDLRSASKPATNPTDC